MKLARSLTLAVALLAATLLAASAQAVTIATWPFSAGTSHLATVLVSNTTGINLTRGPGISVNSGGTFNSRDWTEANLSAAVSAGDYLQFGVTLDPGYAIDFNQFSTELDRSGTGPGTAHLLVSNDGFATYTDLGSNSISESGALETWNFSQTLTGTVQFRIYAFGASSGAGTMDPESTLVLSGSNPYLVPEPASLALLGMGALCVVRRRRDA